MLTGKTWEYPNRFKYKDEILSLMKLGVKFRIQFLHQKKKSEIKYTWNRGEEFLCHVLPIFSSFSEYVLFDFGKLDLEVDFQWEVLACEVELNG